jgi:hypothetical protein
VNALACRVYDGPILYAHHGVGYVADGCHANGFAHGSRCGRQNNIARHQHGIVQPLKPIGRRGRDHAKIILAKRSISSMFKPVPSTSIVSISTWTVPLALSTGCTDFVFVAERPCQKIAQLADERDKLLVNCHRSISKPSI